MNKKKLIKRTNDPEELKILRNCIVLQLSYFPRRLLSQPISDNDHNKAYKIYLNFLVPILNGNNKIVWRISPYE